MSEIADQIKECVKNANGMGFMKSPEQQMLEALNRDNEDLMKINIPPLPPIPEVLPKNPAKCCYVAPPRFECKATETKLVIEYDYLRGFGCFSIAAGIGCLIIFVAKVI